MNILMQSLKSQGRFVGFTTVSWTALGAAVLICRKLLTGNFGPPEFVGIIFLTPVVAVVWSSVMWKLFFSKRPR